MGRVRRAPTRDAPTGDGGRWGGRFFEGIGMAGGGGCPQGAPLRGDVFLGCNGGRVVREPPLRGMGSWVAMGEGRFANRPYGGLRSLARGVMGSRRRGNNG